MTMQGNSARGRDTILVMTEIGYRVGSPLPLWKLRKNRAYDAAHARVDALIGSCIARERANIAAATTTAGAAAATGAGTTADATAAGTTGSSSGTDDVCLLNKLLQCKIGEGDVSDDVANRKEEVTRHSYKTLYTSVCSYLKWACSSV
jgi:hypothetical protein